MQWHAALSAVTSQPLLPPGRFACGEAPSSRDSQSAAFRSVASDPPLLSGTDRIPPRYYASIHGAASTAGYAWSIERFRPSSPPPFVSAASELDARAVRNVSRRTRTRWNSQRTEPRALRVGLGRVNVALVYTKTRKLPDLFWNLYVCRPVAAVLVDLLKDTRVTPNQITLAAVVVTAISAAMLIGWPGYAGLVAAVVVFELSYVLDCADGMLARWRGIQSTAGHLLDFLMDEIKAFVMLGAVAARLFHQRRGDRRRSSTEAIRKTSGLAARAGRAVRREHRQVLDPLSVVHSLRGRSWQNRILFLSLHRRQCALRAPSTCRRCVSLWPRVARAASLDTTRIHPNAPSQRRRRRSRACRPNFD